MCPYRKDQNFEDPEFYQAKKQIKERFNKILTDLQQTVERNGYAVVTVQRFRGCLENSDVSRLPFYSNSAFSKKRNKIMCVLSVVSYAIQLYWKFCAGNNDAKVLINSYLNDLEIIIENGLKHFKATQVKGFSGYFLKEIE